MTRNKLIATAILVAMSFSEHGYAFEQVNSDELISAKTKTKQFVTSVTVQSQTTDVKEGIEIYKRPDGSCYQLSRTITAVDRDKTEILGIDIELPEITTEIKDSPCVLP